METEDRQIVDRLYQSAAKRSLEYGCFLLRVTGMEHFNGDPIILLMNDLTEGDATIEQVDNCKDFWVLLINLSRLAEGGQYMPTPLNAPLGSPYITDFYNASLPMLSDELRSLISHSRDEGNFLELSGYILKCYADAFAEFFSINPRYVRDRQFTVTEFYIDQEAAGLRAHHSNGTMSTFRRNENATTGTNLSLGDTVGYYVGDVSKLRKEWLINGEPMYKAKLWGKYNSDGEWKPIVYTGDPEIAKEAALKFSEDPDIQGVFFYMYTTGFPILEFIVKTNGELPDPRIEFGNGVTLYRIKNDNHKAKNEYIYDGWMRFEDLSERGIRDAIDTLRQTLDGLTFAFGIESTWQVKYRLTPHSPRGIAIPSHKDLESTNKLISAIHESRDRDSLIAAVNWYALGTKSDHPIVAYTCYYTALESLALQLAEGTLRASIFYKTQISKPSDDGLGHLLDTLENAFESVYGNDHKFYKALFNKRDGLIKLGYTATRMSRSEWDDEQYYKSRQHLGMLRNITSDFIRMLSLQIPQGEQPPVLSHKHKVHVDAAHTGPALVVNDLKHLPNTTWDIRPEWLSI